MTVGYYHGLLVARDQRVGCLLVRAPPQLLGAHASALALLEEVPVGL